MRHKSFAVFILSHGRANNVLTYKTLKSIGYKGDIYIICDDLDPELDLYKKKFPKVIVFDKQAAALECDACDNTGKLDSVLFARNQCHRIAKELGLQYFLELDDDYIHFKYRYIKNGMLKDYVLKDKIEDIFDIYLDFLDASGATVIAMPQTGELQGGCHYFYRIAFKRKAMNTFFCRTDKPFKFVGRLNDDVNMYLTLNKFGEKVFQVGPCVLDQKRTQEQSGGLTDMYLESGTYWKSMVSVMICPSAVRAVYQTALGRIHHRINYNRICPKLIREQNA